MKIETEVAIKKICDLDLGWRMNWECVWKALDILRGRGDGTDKNTSTVDDPMSCRTFLRRNFKELEEAATIDGANDFQILCRVYLPLSLASIATLVLFYAVGKWNSFQDAMYYIQDRDLQPLQLRLYNIIKGSTAVEVSVQEGNANSLASEVSESIESATIMFATLPILVVYPFVQRYFVAGVTLGAVKG